MVKKRTKKADTLSIRFSLEKFICQALYDDALYTHRQHLQMQAP